MLLFLLATGQRLQALHLLKREDIHWEDTCLRIQYTEKLKTNDPNVNPLKFMFEQHEELSLCIYSHLKAYLAREETLPAAPYVFSTVKLPTVRASSATISRQVKATLRQAGVGEDFTAYSARHATTSAAARNNVPLNTILQSAGWTRETTFSRFYNRPLVTPPCMEETNFIPRLLE
jgi:integrase